MLKRFEVENFKGFKDNIVLDLTARDYCYNSEIVKNGIVNKALIYGKNGVGKSNLGIAMFDIILHLTDKQRLPDLYLANYRNYDSNKPYAKFKYVFQFEQNEVIYEYSKLDPFSLYEENLTIDGKLVLRYNYLYKEKNLIDKNLFGSLKFELIDNRLSIIKYIYRNTPTNTLPPLTEMVRFCENMLWYRSLSDGNNYAGFTNGASFLVDMLFESGKLKEFENFLVANGLNYKLSFESNNGKNELWAEYTNGRVPFNLIASTGTKALFLFFVWSISFDKISLLFIDEFDAFFHYESARNIVSILNKATSFQTFLTTHNTYLMNNKLTRPDCCFIMTQNKITNLCNATPKEIREAHNLEKMYINGVFYE